MHPVPAAIRRSGVGPGKRHSDSLRSARIYRARYTVFDDIDLATVSQDSITQRTPVHCAAAAGHADCLALLLENMDDPSVVNRYDVKQRTALMLAVANNNQECAILLLKYKADCNLLDVNKHTPLFRAVVNERDHQLVKLLLKHGARVAVQDASGKTPLHLAAACDRHVKRHEKNL